VSILVQISDTHFGTEQPPVVEALLELVRSLRPTLAVLSGDITQRARRSQFEAARKFVERLEAHRVIAIPGNHDIPLFNLAARVLSPYANYCRAFGEVLEPEFESDALLVLCVNTTRPSRHKDGEVSRTQIQRVAARLRHAAAEQLRVVVTHQPVLAIKREDEANLLHGWEEAVRRWSTAGADILMGGHIHLPYIRSLTEALPTLARRAWVVQAGTAVSHRIRSGIPNSVNVVRHAAPDSFFKVERWNYDAATGALALVKDERLPLDRGRSRLAAAERA
jgi:3',5'-cyclic AMP phosphodiesterase CpdA